jgi:hypothetical protein
LLAGRYKNIGQYLHCVGPFLFLFDSKGPLPILACILQGGMSWLEEQPLSGIGVE